MKLLYVNKLPFFTYLIIMGELQKFTNIIVLYPVLSEKAIYTIIPGYFVGFYNFN